MQGKWGLDTGVAPGCLYYFVWTHREPVASLFESAFMAVIGIWSGPTVAFAK